MDLFSSWLFSIYSLGLCQLGTPHLSLKYLEKTIDKLNKIKYNNNVKKIKNPREVNKMTKVSYIVIYPDNTKKIVTTLAEAQAVKSMGGKYRVVYSKL